MNTYLSHKLKVLQFFLIVFVTYVHSYNLMLFYDPSNKKLVLNLNTFIQEFVTEGLTRIAVPFLFIISGYLFFLKVDEGSLSEFFHKFTTRLRTVGIPFLISSALGLLFNFTLQSIPWIKPFYEGKLVKDFSWGHLLEVFFLKPVPFQLWFLQDLLVLSLLSPLIYVGIRKLRVFFLAPLLLIWFLEPQLFILESESLLFFTCGGLISIYYPYFSLFKSQHRTLLTCFLFSWLICSATTAVLACENYERMGIAHVLVKIGILVGIPATWMLYDYVFCKSLPGKKLMLLSASSFFIYLYHEPLQTVVTKGIFILLGKTTISSFFIYLISPVIVICILILTGRLMKKVMPRFFSLVIGGR